MTTSIYLLIPDYSKKNRIDRYGDLVYSIERQLLYNPDSSEFSAFSIRLKHSINSVTQLQILKISSKSEVTFVHSIQNPIEIPYYYQHMWFLFGKDIKMFSCSFIQLSSLLLYLILSSYICDVFKNQRHVHILQYYIEAKQNAVHRPSNNIYIHGHENLSYSVVNINKRDVDDNNRIHPMNC